MTREDPGGDVWASERRLRSLVEATMSIVWTADPVRGFVAPQPSWERYTGQPFEEHRGFGWVAAVHEEDRDRVVAAWRDASRRAEVFHEEGRLWHATTRAYRWCISRGAPVIDDTGRFEEWIGTCTDVHDQVLEREEAAERATRLGRVTSALAAAMTDEDVAGAISAELRPSFGADTFVLRVLSDDGSGLRAVRMEGYPESIRAEFEVLPLSRATGVGDTFRSGIPTFVESVEEYARRYPEMAGWREATGVRTWAYLPLATEGVTLGVLHLGFRWERRFSEQERTFLATLATVSAQAIRRARLLRAEQAARAEAEAAARRLRRLQDISDVALSRLSIEELVAALRDRLRTVLAVDIVRIMLLDEGGTHLRLAAVPDDDPAGPGFRVPLGRGFSGRVAIAGRPVLASDASTMERLDPVLDGVRSLAGVPLVVGRRLVGALVVGTYASRHFDDADVELLELTAERIALAIDRSRAFEIQRRLARTLQAALLPPSLPTVPNLSLAARYIAAGEGTDVGGDFYDVFPVRDGAWLAIMGDVCGRGPEAAAMTGLARHTVRAVAQENGQPAEVLARLNATLGSEGGDERFATAVCARLETRPGGAAMVLASGGHCRPIVLRADGRAEVVAVRGTMLGPFPEVHLDEVAVDLAEGDSLVLYTDGVVEAQGPSGLFGEARLLELLTANVGRTSAELAGIVEEAVGAHSGGAANDDLAVVVLQVPPSIPAEVIFDERLPSGHLAARAARRSVERALAGRLPADTLDRVRLAVSELATNAVRHGAPGRPGEAGPGLRILLSEIAVRVEVRNRGRGFSLRARPAGLLAESGRGLDVVRAVATSTGIDEEGTIVSVWCTFDLDGHPARR